MGTLDDAIREHLELKRRLGAPENELEQKEAEAFGPIGARPPVTAAAPPETAADEPPEPEALEPEVATEHAESAEPAPAEPAGGWTDEGVLDRDEVLPEDSLEPNGSYAAPDPLPAPRKAPGPREDPPDDWEEEGEDPPAGEDVLEETPEFLEETPEHDRLWFEQKPPKDFDFD
jgi:hypothetical protein